LILKYKIIIIMATKKTLNTLLGISIFFLFISAFFYFGFHYEKGKLTWKWKTGVEQIDREKLSQALAKYDEFSDFSEGLLKVEKNGKWGLIDKSGKEITSCIYDNISDFSKGFAGVIKNKKLGYIDRTGKEVVPCIYDNILKYGGNINFSDGLVAVSKNGKIGFVDESGKEVIPFIYDNEFYCDNEYEPNFIFFDGLMRIKKNEKWGFIDKQGKTIVPFVYERDCDGMNDFSEGLALVSQYFKESGGWYKYGFVDKSGKEVIPCGYENGSPFSEGLACVQKNGKCGFIDKNGKEAIPFIYYDMSAESEDVAVSTCFKNGMVVLRINEGEDSAYKMNGEDKFGAIDKTGKVVISFRYNDLKQTKNSNLFIYSINEKYGIIDKNEKEIVPCIYDWITEYESGGNGFRASLNGKEGILDNKTGKEIIPFKYDAVRYTDGFYIVSKGDNYSRNSKKGLFDQTGKEILPLIFDDISEFSDGLAKAKWNGQDGFIDKDGYFIGKGLVKKLVEQNNEKKSK